MVRYTSEHDVIMRLNQTYLRYKGIPVWVEGVEGRKVRLYALQGGHLEHVETVSANSEDLVIKAEPLGNMRMTNSWAYTTRLPYRKQKQGLSSNNSVHYPLQTLVGGGLGVRSRHGLGGDLTDVLRSFDWEYPEMQALDSHKRGLMAIHRDIGLHSTKDPKIWGVRFKFYGAGYYSLTDNLLMSTKGVTKSVDKLLIKEMKCEIRKFA